jgi:hypothetical protein
MITKVEKKYNLGVIAPRTAKFEDVYKILNEKLQNIGHILTNDVEEGGNNVIKFALQEKILLTVYPVKHISGGILPSNSYIANHSDFIYILDDGQSGNVNLARKECEKQNKKFKIIKINGTEN